MNHLKTLENKFLYYTIIIIMSLLITGNKSKIKISQIDGLP